MASANNDLRPGEVVITIDRDFDASVYFIGQIRTPWKTAAECPKREDHDGPICRIEVDPLWRGALSGLETATHLQILYWMHHSRRDLTHQNPGSRGRITGTFAIRSPQRPNPIASSNVELVGMENGILLVRGLDCVDGTPLIDIKPDQCPIIHPA